MPDAAIIEEQHERSAMEAAFALFSGPGDSETRIHGLETILEGPQGQQFREEMAGWVLQFLPVDRLVPEMYAHWRPLVREAMRFILSHLSTRRLAPKLVEQVEIPYETRPEVRLLKLIAKVPGLQKLGQVLARNPHLPRALRRALSELENGISDVTAKQVGDVIERQLGSKLEQHQVKIESTIFSEASVSAVVRFTWWN